MKSKDSEVHKGPRKSAKSKSPKKKPRSGRKARRRRRLKAKYLKHIEFSRTLLADKRKTFVPNNSTIFGMSGNCFWQNYCQVFQWRDRHMAGSSDVAQPRQLLPEFQDCASEQTSRCSGDEWSRGAGTYRDNPSPQSSTEENDEDEPDEQYVASEEWIEFLEISMRHKASLKAEREEKKKLEDQKMAERNNREECRQPSIAADNERRHREIVQLYGRRAPTIHGMETATQLTFNRQIDLYDPPYWPILPFSIKFQPRDST